MNSNGQPLVSVCMPTCNGEAYIGDALTSVLKQTYQNIEIVVSDDTSTDETLSVVDRILAGTSIPFSVHSHERAGIGANWNYCIRVAKGEYIKFLFQDDILKPNCIEEMLAVALLDRDIGLVFCRRGFLVNESGYFSEWVDKYKNLHVYWRNLAEVNSGRKLLRECVDLLNEPYNKVGEPTSVLLSKKVCSRVGFFNEKLCQILDYEYWYRVFAHFKIGFVDGELTLFRLHRQQATAINSERPVSDYGRYHKLLLKHLFFHLAPSVQMALLKSVVVWPIILRLRSTLRRMFRGL